MDITSWIIFARFKCIWLVLDFIESIILRNSTNIERSWMYGIYSWTNNTHHKVWKVENILQNQSCGWNLWVNFLMVYDIDIN
jgi:hypothetical protein